MQGKLAYVKVGDSDNMPVHVGAGIFSVPDGEFCFAKGSSGWSLGTGKNRVEFCEIVRRGGSAADAFGKPAGGKVVMWKAITR